MIFWTKFLYHSAITSFYIYCEFCNYNAKYSGNDAKTSESIANEGLDTEKLLASAQAAIDAANELMANNEPPIINDGILILTNFYVEKKRTMSG